MIPKSELAHKAKILLNKILYITLASVDPNGVPWNTPLYSAYDEKHTFYWASWTENMHSKNIAHNKNVFVVIYDSTVPEGTGFGLYLQGTAHVLEAEGEVKHAAKLLAERKNKVPRPHEQYLGSYPRRIYKFVPTQAWVNDEGNNNGNYIDTRVDITADFLCK